MRVLIVTPSFPPSNSPDSGRVRVLAPHLKSLGIDPTVLAVDPSDVSAVRDEWISEGVPQSLTVERVRARGLIWRLFRIKSLGVRSLLPLFFRGASLHRSNPFDLVFLSSSVAESFILGFMWKLLYNLPFVVDIQDPIYNTFYDDKKSIVPPGGRLKFNVVNFALRFVERLVLQKAAGVVSVSKSFIDDTRIRCRNQIPSLILIQPFPAPVDDLIRASIKFRPNPTPSCRLVSYVGALTAGMMKPCEILIRAVAFLSSSNSSQPYQARFVGTSYYGSRRFLGPTEVAARLNCTSVVTEIKSRVSYYESLCELIAANVVVFLGSSDLGYVPSKAKTLEAIDRPVLAIVFRGSQAESAAMGLACKKAVICLEPEEDDVKLVMQVAFSLEKLFMDCSCSSAPAIKVDSSLRNAEELATFLLSATSNSSCST